jgi:ferredoxin--NADP+ reductase
MMSDDRASIVEARRALRAQRADKGSATGSTPHPTDPGPELPEVTQHLVRPTEPVTGTVIATELCTNPKPAGYVRHVTIDVSNTPLAGAFLPGQSFGVVPPGANERGRAHKPRLYSISSPTRGEELPTPDADPDATPDAKTDASTRSKTAACQSTPVVGPGSGGSLISTTVKRTIDEHWDDHRLFLGVASNLLCDAQVGDTVQVTGPAGKRFLLPERPEEHDYLFIATGTGIAPFRGMILDLLERGCGSKIVLVMGTPYATDLLYHEWFTNLDAAHPNFHYRTAISRERLQLDDRPGRMYVQDRVDAEWDLIAPMFTGSVDRPGRGLVYLCGIAGMELGILRTLWARLDADSRPVYLETDDAMSDPSMWTRAMIRRQVRPSRRVFMEVY